MKDMDQLETAVTEIPLPARVKDIRGVRRGLLVAVKYIGVLENRHSNWLCQCDCGNTHEVDGATFLRWSCRSCGCYRDKAVGDANRTHGMSGTPEYAILASIIARTTNPNHPAYPRYGGRGITVCDRWRHSVQNFIDDMGPRPSPNHSVERLDNSKGYCPENCAWRTAKEQARNRRSNRMIEHGGERMTMIEWTERLGLSRSAIRLRLEDGWSIEEAVTTPSTRPKKDPLANFEWV